jgi:hypothetical protein
MSGGMDRLGVGVLYHESSTESDKGVPGRRQEGQVVYELDKWPAP